MALDASAGMPDVYFFMWTLTDEGVENPAKLLDTIRRASQMVRQSGGECHLHVCFAEPFDMIGIAKGMGATQMVEMQHAIDSLGTVKTTFVPTKEYSLGEYEAFIANVIKFRDVSPGAASAKRKR
jgi:uncharacterized protein with GYD domain